MKEPSNRLPRLSRTTIGEYAIIFVAAPIITFFVGRFLDTVFLLPKFPPFPANLVAGFSIFLFGLAMGIKSTRTLYYKGKGLPWGEVKKQDQSTRLVTTGLYACCRHPMTFGYSLLPSGMGILFRSLSMTFFIPAIIFLAMITWLRLREEPSLERRFGQAYRDYRRQTPFLIPRLRPLIIDLAAPILRLIQKEKRDLPEVEEPDHNRK